MTEMSKQFKTTVNLTIFQLKMQRLGNCMRTILSVTSTALQIRVLSSQTTYWGLFFFNLTHVIALHIMLASSSTCQGHAVTKKFVSWEFHKCLQNQKQ